MEKEKIILQDLCWIIITCCYKLVAVDLSKQKELDADPRAIQQIEFKYMLGTNSTIYWVLDKSKETILEFYKGTVKVYYNKI